MTLTVKIPTPLRTLTLGQSEVTLESATHLAHAIDQLEAKYGGIRERLLDEKGVRKFINMYVGDEDVRFLEGLNTPLKDGDIISIVPAIAGG